MDSARRRSSKGHSWSYFTSNIVYSTCQVTSFSSSSLLFENRRCFHVNLYHVKYLILFISSKVVYTKRPLKISKFHYSTTKRFYFSYRFVFMALMEYCVVTIVLGDYEFARAVRRARTGNQEESPTAVIITYFLANNLL